MKEIVLESHGVRCLVKASRGLVDAISGAEFTRHYIPDLKFELPTGDCDVSAVEDSNLTQKAELRFPLIRFSPGVEFRSVVSAADYLMERVRQEKFGIYCLNSATVSSGDSAVTFWGGATNLGKTSSALELMQRGFEFYSDERTLLNLRQGSVVGGSRTIAVRKAILREKTKNPSGEFCEHSCAQGDKRIALFVYPHIDHGLENPIFYQFEPKDFHWLLSREFGCNIRGAVKFMDDYTHPLPSIDTQELAEKRARETIAFTQSVPCYYFQGSLAQTSSFVGDFFKQNVAK